MNNAPNEYVELLKFIQKEGVSDFLNAVRESNCAEELADKLYYLGIKPLPKEANSDEVSVRLTDGFIHSTEMLRQGHFKSEKERLTFDYFLIVGAALVHRPVKFGKWLVENGKASCSVCGESYSEKSLPRLRFCPYCGNVMFSDEIAAEISAFLSELGGEKDEEQR